MDANSRQVGGNHYNSKFQHWDLVRHLNMPYLSAQITRYVARWKKKNGTEDLDKALHYIDKFIEEETVRRASYLAAMERFIFENSLEEHESIVFNMLINYNLGDGDRLIEARDAIQKLISDCKLKAKLEPPVYPTKAPIPLEYYTNLKKDPEFLEPRDEWKNN